MENNPPSVLPETLPSSKLKNVLSEKVFTVEHSAGTAKSLPTSISEDRSSTEEQKCSNPPHQPLLEQISSAEPECQYGLQIVKERSHSQSQMDQAQPDGKNAGLLVTLGSEKEQNITLEYNPETETNMEFGRQALTDGNVLLQSQMPCTVSSSSLPTTSSDFREPEKEEVVVWPGGESGVPTDGCSPATPSEPVWTADSQKDSNDSPALSSTENTEIKENSLSETQPETVGEISNETGETQKVYSAESLGAFQHTKTLVVAGIIETQPQSSEVLTSPEVKELNLGLFSSLEGERSVPTNLVVEHCDDDVKEAQPDAATPSVLPEISSDPTPLFNTDLVVSLHAGEVLNANVSHTSDQVPTAEASLIAEIVHSTNAQEIVVVREGTHITGDWSGMHLNQSYLVQQEDGTVCEAAIVNELSTGEPKLYEGGVEAGMELDSQPVEVYEFCGLVEEVAEETVCGGSGTQMPHSPGYEVNLFNALLENADEFTIKEDLESSIHAVNEGETFIISQQSLSPSGDHGTHNLSIQKARIAAVGQHLILDNQAVGVSHSGEVCLVQVAAVASESFTVQQTDTSTQIDGHCLEDCGGDLESCDLASPKVNAAAGPSSFQSSTVAISSGNTVMQQSIAAPVHISCAEEQTCVSSNEGTKETPDSTPSLNVPAAVAPAEPKPEGVSTARYPRVINPKLLVLKAGETALLKHPASFLAHASKQPNVDTTVAKVRSSRSGTASEECLPAAVSATSLTLSVAPPGRGNQTQMFVETKSADDQTSTLRGATPLQFKDITPTASASKSEAFTISKTQIHVGDAASHNTETDTPTSPEENNGVEVTAADVINPNTSIPDYVDDDSEDSEPDKPEEEGEVLEALSGLVSSQGEDSDDDEDDDDDDEPDAEESELTSSSSSRKHGQNRIAGQALFLKVRQWISDRVSAGSPSTASSFTGQSSSSSWSTPRRDKSSPLRGPHGKFVSPTTTGHSSSSSPPDQVTSHKSRGERVTDMAELAKHEADIEHRTQALKREGFWSTKRLTRLTEPQRPKVHWDYLCEEMQWLSADFAQERRWKRGVARKVVRMVMRHHEDLRQKEEKAKRDEHAKVRKIASSIAKEVRAFWSNVEKVVQFKQQSRLEEKRKKALDLQLDFIVGQTEKYSDLLTKSLAPNRPAEVVVSPQKSHPTTTDDDDRDFEPTCEEEDDEETIEVEEQQEGNDAESHQREIELLKEEGMLPLDQLLSTLKLPPPQVLEEEESSSGSSASEEDEEGAQEDEDGEFTANEEDAEDEEDTIAAQEKIEGNVDHAEELDDLNREGDMTMEELLEKYKGAYASDFEAPSGSASKASSDSEVSGDDEEESEEDESDVESNTSSSESPGDSAEDDDDDSEKEDDNIEDEDEGMELLLKEGSPSSSGSRPKKEISHIAATAESLQPKGYTLATTKVKTPIPFLLHGTLREYQHIGLDWLVTMYEKKLNGILADEMGLGKTIQTIAVLAHLACEKGNWGPHLIIVPTSVMLNWEMELKRWCPGFKILTYFGSQKERKMKRQGWTKPNAFHVCITSYKLVLQDHQAFRRKSWRYLILDEAQNIKNFKSQRWQSLLNFNSHRRLLLTGTPLQNSLMELWSLMHFLMPHVFQSHREFKEWFSNPLTGMIEGSQEYNEGLVKRLHKVLRPFLLRRIKADVEKQMPKKYEHVVRCRLSKRQRFLYDDFMAQASTRETLASGHFMSVINILMQLRKVCNHPNLFDPRPIQSPFITQRIVFRTASLVQDVLDVHPLKRCDLSVFDLIGLEERVSRYQADVFLPRYKVNRQLIQEIVESPAHPPRPKPLRMKIDRVYQPPPKTDSRPVLLMNKPVCSVPPAAQTPTTSVAEASSAPAPAPAPAVQQVVCSMAPTPPPPRPPVYPPQTAVRSSTPRPILSIRPPAAPCTTGIPAHPSPNTSSVMPQRVLLSPDMQARLPSGEVVSIAQLASLAGRPVSSCQGSKPVTFQLQGNKLTLSGAQIHQVPTASPRPVQGNVMHLVSSGVQHHLISQPAQLTVQTTSNAQSANTPTATPPPNRVQQNVSAQTPSTMVSSQGVVKIVVRQSTGKEGGPVPTLAVAPSPRVAPQASSSVAPQINAIPVRNTAPLQIAPRTPGPATVHYTIVPPPRHPSSTPNQPQTPRPVLKVVQRPSSFEQPAPAPATASTSAPKAVAEPKDDGKSSKTPEATTSKPSVRPKVSAQPRRFPRPVPRSPFYTAWLDKILKEQRDSRLDLIFRTNEQRCRAKPVYGHEVLNFLTFLPGSHPSPAALSAGGGWARSGHSSCLYAQHQNKSDLWFLGHVVRENIHSIEARLDRLTNIIDRFTFVISPVEAPPISMHCCHPPPSLSQKQADFSSTLTAHVRPLTRSLHRIQCNMRTQFPDLRLIQYDCGKLQTLHVLLRRLKSEGHRVLIFTQMTRMLDVLEQFLNYHGHIYLRLDGSTRVEQRQALMERFNADRRIFCFILSTRSGGVGVNLTGADTVVFYDSDWNPTMDAQAQDRCHRIGQTRDVHIYRLISERTVEENILKKANQKRMLGDMAIEGGNFTTAFFKEQTIRELFDVNDSEKRDAAVELSVPQSEEDDGVNKQSTTILEQALCRAEDEEDIVAASQAKAEQVAELAEFNENIPLDDGGDQEEAEELSKAEQEIAALVEQLTPIERYAMNFLEASQEDVNKEELKQAEEQVEAARKDLDQAKEEGLMLHRSSDEDDDFLPTPISAEPAHPTPARRGRKPKDKTLTSTRTSGRLRGASPEPEPVNSRDVPERLRRGRGVARDAAASNSQRADGHKATTSSRSIKTSPPMKDQPFPKNRTQASRSLHSTVPSSLLSGGRQQSGGEAEGRGFRGGREEREARMFDPFTDTAGRPNKEDDGKDHGAMSSPYSRSPRKRQSADGVVLQGLADDSPSAKVLRRLPGRLVTVVEEKEKEPRRRRRRGSGTGGAGQNEDAHADENAAGMLEQHKDDTSPRPADGQDSGSPVHRHPARSYPPYSPPHLSPDMPVLRNLPVRSRMAAQMGEQQLHMGRGRGVGQYKKTEASPVKDAPGVSPDSSANPLNTPLKRKRGRPPKALQASPELDDKVSPSRPTPRNEERTPPLSPKRKRGRPRKDSSAAEALLPPESPAIGPTLSLAEPPDTKTSPNPTPVFALTQAPASTTAPEILPSPLPSHPAPAPSCSPALVPQTAPVPPVSSLVDSTSPTAVSPPPCISLPTPPSEQSTSAVPAESNSLSTPAPASAPATAPVLVQLASPSQPVVNVTSDTPSPTSLLPTTLSQPIPASLTTTPQPADITANLKPPPADADLIQSPNSASAECATPDSTPSEETIPDTSETTLPPDPTTTQAAHTPVPPPDSTPTKTHDSEPIGTLTAAPLEPVTTATASAPTTLNPETGETQNKAVSIAAPLPTTTTAREEGSEALISSPAPAAATSVPVPAAETNAALQIPSALTEETKGAEKGPSSPTLEATAQVEAPAITTAPPEDVAPSHKEPPPPTTPAEEAPPAANPHIPALAPPSDSKPSSAEDLQESASEHPLDSSVKETPEVLQEKCGSGSDAEDKEEAEDGEAQQENGKHKSPENQEPGTSVESQDIREEGEEAAPKEKTHQRSETEDHNDSQRSEKVGHPEPPQKRSLSRESSQESTRSSSPSSGCSTATLTRHAHHKRTYENRHPTKRKRLDDPAEGGKGGGEDDGGEEKPSASRRRHSRSSSMSSDSDSSGSRKRLTRSAKRRLQDQDKEPGTKGRGVARAPQGEDKSAPNNAHNSAGESGSDSSSAQGTGKPAHDSKVVSNPVPAPAPPPEPEVLGKRCSALNAAAKLLAMKGRVDTPGHTPRRDSKTLGSSPDKKAKSALASPQGNSLGQNQSAGGKPSPPTESGPPASRSTRRCPGALVPPLENEYKRVKTEVKDGEGKKVTRRKESERGAQSSSRGNSACSSMSSDGEGGGRSSRSSSNSSQRTRSVSSQNTERCSPRSRAASSGSDRSAERRGAKEAQRRESRRSHRQQPPPQEVASSSGAEGTPDRVLRSVAALAAAQARSPAASTRSSAGQQQQQLQQQQQQRSNKT